MSNEHRIKSKYQDIKTEIIERLSDVSQSYIDNKVQPCIVVYYIDSEYDDMVNVRRDFIPIPIKYRGYTTFHAYVEPDDIECIVNRLHDIMIVKGKEVISIMFK